MCIGICREFCTFLSFLCVSCFQKVCIWTDFLRVFGQTRWVLPPKKCVFRFASLPIFEGIVIYRFFVGYTYLLWLLRLIFQILRVPINGVWSAFPLFLRVSVKLDVSFHPQIVNLDFLGCRNLRVL